jgi:hypothetical protein
VLGSHLLPLSLYASSLRRDGRQGPRNRAGLFDRDRRAWASMPPVMWNCLERESSSSSCPSAVWGVCACGLGGAGGGGEYRPPEGGGGGGGG